MSDEAALRRLALALPEVIEAGEGGRFAFEVAGKGLAWSYLARAKPRGKRTPQPGHVAIRCDLARKEMLVEAAPDRFFDDAHYRGFPAVLVRLEAIDEAELDGLLRAAWRMQAPPAVRRRHADMTPEAGATA